MPKKDVFQAILSEVDACDPEMANKLVVLVDGDHRLENLAKRTFGDRQDSQLLLDIMHALKYL